MPRPSLTRQVASLLSATLVTGLSLLLGVTLLAAPASAGDASERAPRRDTNPTGTASGSQVNGAGNLKLRLAQTANGRIKVSWRRPGPASRFRKVVVQVSPGRKMVTKLQSYKVNRRKQSLIVSHAFGATPASGRYSFVKVIYVRRDRSRSQSPAKWIQAPITSECRAAAKDQATVASFNVRTWTGDTKPSSATYWGRRGPNVITEILRSGAHAIAIQEASGKAGIGFGPKTQQRWILDELNDKDPDTTAQWVDALPDSAYKPPAGRTPGHIGTRVFYDASKYTELDAGMDRVQDSVAKMDSLVPWVRLQSVSGTQAPFVLTSNHLAVGNPAGNLRDWQLRGRQTQQTIAHLRRLRSVFGDTVVLAGDLNSTANTIPYDNAHYLLMRAGFYDAYASRRISGAAYPTTTQGVFPVPRTPLRRDYILTLGAVKGSCGYVNQTYNRAAQIASDHFLQRATLPLPAL
ncbi:hypothetical protein [Nocardioides lijunqiniae]|uniref:hypothetical protein n=1 Tax=Nocardioides lijunqiniae TaxID=2760832 RepID=UPI00187877C3|nr:hypothetical protein [Nocardioides lijunqiniae]